MADFKKISAFDIQETVSDTTNVVIEDNGNIRRLPASEIKGGKVFIIDATADDYSTTDTAYGNTIKEALLNGDRVMYYAGAAYFLIDAFYVTESTTGDYTITVCTRGQDSTNGGITTANTAVSYTFAITV